ncbi:hypothetical protein R69746_08028 [Paraburkholderia aspalathi]|nr:hypothetical protein R69746_08028 [Paraburkholderia aspalathi]
MHLVGDNFPGYPGTSCQQAFEETYFGKAIGQNGDPETITVDKSGANLAALEAFST